MKQWEVINMNSNTNNEIQNEFNKFFIDKKESKKDQDKHAAKIIMYRFLSEVERLSEEKNIKRKQLAKLIGTSASYITQLFKGSKLLNLETAAKFERVFDIKFDIRAYPKDALVKERIVYITTVQINLADTTYIYDNTKQSKFTFFDEPFKTAYLSDVREQTEVSIKPATLK